MLVTVLIISVVLALGTEVLNRTHSNEFTSTYYLCSNSFKTFRDIAESFSKELLSLSLFSLFQLATSLMFTFPLLQSD